MKIRFPIFIFFFGLTVPLFFLPSASLGAKPSENGTKPGGPPPTGVRVTEVKRELLQETISIVGSIESPRESNIGSEVEGIVERLHAEEGDRVVAGQILLELSNTQLKISLAEARAEEDEARNNLLNLKAGSRPQEIREAESVMKEAEFLWEKARKEYERYRKLFTEGVVDERLVTNSKLEAEAAEKNVQQKKSSYELAVEGTRKEEIAKAEAGVRMKEARVALIQDRIKKTSLYAPFDGMIVEKLLEVGEWVTTGKQVFRILQIHPVQVTLPVPETVVSRVSIGAEVTIQMDAFPEKTFSGKVERIIPEADKGARTFPVRLLLENEEGLFKVGMMVRGLIPYGEKREALVIPQDGITVAQGGKHVFIVDPDNTARMVPVETGLLKKGLIEVKGDLKPGERVVIRGGERLRPGMPLRVLNPGVVDVYPNDEKK